MAYLTAVDLSLGYDSRCIAEHLNFTVNRGDYLCILGENGSGKSTLIKTILRLRPPIRGQIVMGDGLESKEIGYLPQQTDVQKDFPASVNEIVLSGLEGRRGPRPFYNKEEKRTAKEAMRRLRIEELSKRCYRELSGGQQQRVLLARAFCATKKLLLLDEPVSGLDPKVTAELYESIRDLNREGMAIVMISHDITAALRYADHILHMGQTNFFGTISEYLNSAFAKTFFTPERGRRHD